MKTIITILILVLSILVVSADTSDIQIVGTITVLAPEIIPTPTQVPSSGGSSSGGGVSSDEPYSNVNSYCRAERDLLPTATYNFDCTLYEINVKDTEREYDVMMRVEDLRGISKNTPIQPEGEVYKFINAFIGTKRLESADLKFKVPVSWASGKNVQLLMWRNNIWNVMEITKISEDSVNVYFSAKTDHFSNFAIVGKQISTEITTPVPTPVVTQVPTPTETPVTTPEKPSGIIPFIISGIIIVVIVIFVEYRARRKK
jgi:PGF-pre-PGF domain-containing protein